jgi:hypothetical protein
MEPRRVLICWEYGASGLGWVSTKEEHEAPEHKWSWLAQAQRPGRPHTHHEFSERLTRKLRDDLQAWNDAWDSDHTPPEEEKEAAARALQEQGRELAVRVQDELGTDGWEVLYQILGRMYRVHPPASWPIETWEQELLGYKSQDQQHAEEQARYLRFLQAIRERNRQTRADGSTSPDP